MVELEGFLEISPVLKAGVYALVAKGVVIYIGKSKTLYSRIYTHRQNWSRARSGKLPPAWMTVRGFLFDQVFIRPCHVDRLDELEAEMINKYKPRYNVNLKTPGRPTAPFEIKVNGRVLILNAPAPAFERRI